MKYFLIFLGFYNTSEMYTKTKMFAKYHYYLLLQDSLKVESENTDNIAKKKFYNCKSYKS